MANLYKLHKTANNVLVPWSIFFSRAARSLEICHSSNIKAIGHGSFFVPKKPPCHPRFHTSIAPRPIASIHRDPISFKYYWINHAADATDLYGNSSRNRTTAGRSLALDDPMWLSLTASAGFPRESQGALLLACKLRDGRCQETSGPCDT